jgi:membrane protein implicated in regulation of membrane protease activity
MEYVSNDFNTITWIWLAAGIILMLVEILIPGLVVVFLGLAALAVAALRYFGILASELNSLTAWFIISLFFILSLRWLALRIFPPDTSFERPLEDEDAMGAIVEVIQDITDRDTSGRIKFQGTTWPAICHEGEIKKGKKAKLLFRDNLSWVVESHLDSED